MKHILWFLLTALCMCRGVAAEAASINDLTRLVKHLINPAEQRKDVSYLTLANKDEVQVVFVEDGYRYSIYFSGVAATRTEQWITASVRPEGIQGNALCKGFEDKGLDGGVDMMTSAYTSVDVCNKAVRKHPEEGADEIQFSTDFRVRARDRHNEDFSRQRYDDVVRATLKFYEGK